MHLLRIVSILPILTSALSIPSDIRRDAVASQERDTLLASRDEAVALPNILLSERAPLRSTLEKRRGGGGGGGGRGGGSSGSSSSGSSSGGSSSSSGGKGGGSSSSSSSSSGSSAGGRGGSTSVSPSFGGGRSFPGGSTSSYVSGSRSPSGLSPSLLGAGALGFGAGALLFGGLGAYVRDLRHMLETWISDFFPQSYPYTHPYYYTDPQSHQNQSLPVDCLCAQYNPCGCDGQSSAKPISKWISLLTKTRHQQSDSYHTDAAGSKYS